MSQNQSVAVNVVPQDPSPVDTRDFDQVESSLATADNSVNQESIEKARLLEEIAIYEEKNNKLITENISLHEKVSLNERTIERDLESRRAAHQKEIAKYELSYENIQELSSYSMKYSKLKDMHNKLIAKTQRLNDENVSSTVRNERMQDQINDKMVEVERVSTSIEQVRSDAEQKTELKRKTIEDKTVVISRLGQLTTDRVEAENLVKIKDEELKLQATTHKAKLKDIASKFELAIKERKRKHEENYELKVQLHREKIRKEYDEKYRALDRELAALHNAKMESEKSAIKKVENEMYHFQTKVDLTKVRLRIVENNTELERETCGLLKIQEDNLKNDIAASHRDFENVLNARDHAIKRHEAEKKMWVDNVHLRKLENEKIVQEKDMVKGRFEGITGVYWEDPPQGSD